MAVDLPIDLFQATVRITQPLPDGKFGQGTGFLVSAPTPGGVPRVVLVTADHVLSEKMLGDEVQIGLRQQDSGGVWLYAPQTVRIRYGGAQLWTRHPAQDIAVMSVQVPPEAARAAIPLGWLGEADAFERYGVRPGDEMMSVGFPGGLSSNPEGFPILRTGRVASFPLTPYSAYPTFLIDAAIFAGNSGGPVFVARPAAPAAAAVQFIAGLVTKQVEYDDRHYDLGIVVQAAFIRETIALLDNPPPPTPPPALVARPSARGSGRAEAHR